MTQTGTLKLMDSTPSMPADRIGIVTLTEACDFVQSYESACNSHTVHVPAGSTAELRSNGYYVIATFEGTITSSMIVNRLFGHQSAEVDKLVGQVRKYTCTQYAYAALYAIFAGTFLGNAAVELDDDVRIVYRQFDHGEHGGRKFHSSLARVQA